MGELGSAATASCIHLYGGGLAQNHTKAIWRQPTEAWAVRPKESGDDFQYGLRAVGGGLVQELNCTAVSNGRGARPRRLRSAGTSNSSEWITAGVARYHRAIGVRPRPRRGGG